MSNYEADRVGSACIAERRALDTISGRLVTTYLTDGEVVELQLQDGDGRSMLGQVKQVVSVRADPLDHSTFGDVLGRSHTI